MRRIFLAICVLLATCVLQAIGCQAIGAAELRRDIEYATAGGETLRLDASIPDGEGPFPIAILIHGGGWGGGDRAEVHVPPTEPFTDANFTWFSIDYRLAPKHRWPACIDDVRTAIRWVREHAADYKGDPNRVVLVGYSAGGHLAALAATTAADDTRPQAMIILAGPTDLVADCQRRGQVSPSLQALFDHPPALDDAIRIKLREASPLTHVSKSTPPCLLIHGTADESVPYSQSENFQAKLRDHGVPCDLITIDAASHRLREWNSHRPNYEREMIDWLRRQVLMRQ